MVTALLGLLTAIVVLIGAVTDQGWLPSFVKDPAQNVLPGQQPGEPGDGAQGSGREGEGGGTDGGGTAATNPPAPPTVSPDTCLQGFVWREAIADDHVCVTPEMRDQVQEDNRLAGSRRTG